jgi:hypothetical protein
MRGLLLNYQFGMWDAVLKNLKTNTRRSGGLHDINKNPGNYKFVGFNEYRNSVYAEFSNVWTGVITMVIVRHPVGSYAYLQEPVLQTSNELYYKYRDVNGHSEAETFAPLIEFAIKTGHTWTNKYYMPEKQARYFVKFTNVEVMRLNDISIRDCLLEGIQRQHTTFYYTKDNVKKFFPTPQKAYFSLYNSVNGTEENNNPWLFSYHFELCQKPQI